MQPQQPADPSSEEPSADAPATEAGSEQGHRASNFLQRLWRGKRGSAEPEAEDQPEAAETSSAITLTQEELDRRVQAETDRREARRAQAAQAAERRRLRDEDPWAYAEQERTAEQMAQSNATVANMFSQIGAEHDRSTLDPLVQSLPEAERDRILKLEGAGQGLTGRKLIVEEGLKALEKHWKAEGARDAEDKLRRNPAFRKQVLNEFRRGTVEPEFIGGGPAAPAADKDVSDILRRGMSSHRSLNGR